MTTSREGPVEFPVSLSYRSLVYKPHSPEDAKRASLQVRRTADAALSSYAATRQRTRVQLRPRATTRANKIPLSSLASDKPESVLISGSFMSSTALKTVPLPTLYNHYQATKKGLRNVVIHSDRYIPATSPADLYQASHNGFTASPLKGERIRTVELARMRKASSAHVPHRTEFGFYMSGRSAPLLRRGEVTSEELQQLQHSFQENSLAPNSALYYGRGVRSSRPHSKAVQDFERKIKAMTGDEGTGGEKAEDFKVGGSGDSDHGNTDIVRDSRPLTPTPSPAPPTDTRSADAVFITEPQNHQN